MHSQYTESEINTNDGLAYFAPLENDRTMDCVFKIPNYTYVLEFKLNKSADEALGQIKDRGYADKYAADPRPMILFGINFSSKQKTVNGWKMIEMTR
ncbi:MAG: PD-(D/E)XK nuclease domain-containing protein [Chloroflexota bacterium]